MTLSEKVAYLKGLAEGLGLDPESSKEGKLISVMMDILEDISVTISEMDDDINELGEAMDVISEDLSDVEEAVFEDELSEDEDEDDEDFFEIKCPNCEEILVIDPEMLEKGEITCPSCNETLTLQIEECCCEDCCEDEKED